MLVKRSGKFAEPILDISENQNKEKKLVNGEILDHWRWLNWEEGTLVEKDLHFGKDEGPIPRNVDDKILGDTYE